MARNRAITTGVMAFTVAVLSACPQIKGDSEAPTVEAVSPADGAEGAGGLAVVRVTFNEPMDPATLTAESFHATGADGAQLEWESRQTARLVPASPFARGAVVTATVTRAFTDLAGNPLAADRSWSFRIGSDSRPPEVVATSPVHAATGVALASALSITFDEALLDTSIGSTTFTVGGATGAVALTAPETISFTPDQPFAPGTVVVATVRGVQDVAGNTMKVPYTWVFTTLSDTTPPRVISTSPDAGATAIPVDAQVSATFDEALDPVTLSASSFTLATASAATTASVSYDRASRTAVLRPASPLEPGALITATLSTAVTDVAGNALAGPHTWTFTTAADTIAPTVVARLPDDQAVGVPLTTTVQVVFSEPIEPTTLTASSFTLHAGLDPVVASVTYEPATRTATLTPSVPLPFATLLNAQVATSVTDLAGNGLATNHLWSFTTVADTVAPRVVRTSPADGSANVAQASVLTATFDEALDATSLDTTSFTVSSGAGPLAGTVSYSPPTFTVTFTPDLPLPSGATVTATLSTAVHDLNGNGLAVPVSFAFSVAADLVPPTVTATVPLANATGVSISAPMRATFSEPMDPATLTTATFRLSRGATPVPATVTYDAPSRTATLTPLAPLAFSAAHTADLTTGVRDAAGNPLASFAWSFTTSADSVPPTVTSTTPANLATAVSPTTAVMVQFDEPMDPVTVQLAAQIDGVPAQAFYDPVLRRLSIQHQPFANSVTITVTVTTMARDTSGNTLAAPYAWSFTTMADTIAPTVTVTSPLDGARLVAQSFTPITATFSEPLDPASVTSATFTVTGAAGTVSYDASTRSAVFTPTAALPADTQLTANLTTGIRDVAGNPLALPRAFTFHTARPPTRISTARPSAGLDPRILYDARGNGLAVWLVATGTGSQLLYARFTPLGGWTAEQLLDAAPEGSHTVEALIVSGSQFSVAWTRKLNGPGSSTALNVTFLSGTTSTTVLAYSGVGFSRVRLIASSSGYLAAWEAAGAYASARVYAAGAWSPVQTFTIGGSTLTRFEAAAGGATFVVAALVAPTLSAWTWSGGAWSAPTSLFSAVVGTTVGAYALTGGTTGAAVAWSVSTTALGTTTVHARTWQGGAWDVDTTFSTAASSVSGLLGASGSVGHAFVWRHNNVPQSAIWSGTAWSGLALPTTANPSALAASGSMYAVTWVPGPGATLQASVFNGTWGPAVALSSTPVTSPALCASTAGFAASWSTTFPDINARVYSAGAWGAVAQLDTARSVFVSARGSGYAATWLLGTAVRVATFSTAWSAPTNVMTLVHEASATNIRAVARGPYGMVAWRQYDMSTSPPQVSQMVRPYNGSSWGTELQLDTGAFLWELVFLNANEVAAAWSSSVATGGASRRVWRKYSFATSTWSAENLMPSPAGTGGVAFTYTGTEFLVAYTDAVGDLWASTSPDGVTWSTPVNVETGRNVLNLRLLTTGSRTLLFRLAYGATRDLSVFTYQGSGAWSAPVHLAYLSAAMGFRVAGNGLGGAGVMAETSFPEMQQSIFNGTSWTSTILGGGTDGVIASNGSTYLTAYRSGLGVALRSAPAMSFSNVPAWGYSIASNGTTYGALVIEQPLTPPQGPVGVSVTPAGPLRGGVLDTAGVCAEVVVASTPGTAGYLGVWGRSDATTAARAVWAAPGL